jgi:uroporphyrinogen-III synthase/uroporphyrinogen III methyltransferase/synthase
VLVTRAAHQAGKLSEGLRFLGAEPVEVPVLEILPPASFEQFDGALSRFDSYDWLVLTSANAVRAVAGRAGTLGVSLVQPSRMKVAAVGDATAAAARKAGFKVDFVPEEYVAESLADGMSGQVTGAKLLIARAAVARDILPDSLRAAGGEVDVVDVYRNVLPEAAPQQLRQALVDGLAAATFTSSSSATHLAEAARAAGVAWPFAGVPAISIGPVTSQTLRDLGWPPAAEAAPSDISGLIVAVTRVLSHG